MSTIEEVAEAKCPCARRNGCLCREGNHHCSCSLEKAYGVVGEDCFACQGTGLRWPTLSQQIPWANGHRVPDVTLEKVLGILLGGWASMELHWPFESPFITGPLDDEVYRGRTLLEAACAALLSSA